MDVHYKVGIRVFNLLSSYELLRFTRKALRRMTQCSAVIARTLLSTMVSIFGPNLRTSAGFAGNNRYIADLRTLLPFWAAYPNLSKRGSAGIHPQRAGRDTCGTGSRRRFVASSASTRYTRLMGEISSSRASAAETPYKLPAEYFDVFRFSVVFFDAVTNKDGRSCR